MGLPRTLEKTKKLDAPLSKKELRNIFESCDTNKDGRLSKDEIKKAFACLGSHMPGWRAEKGLGRADGNRDGYVSDEEIDVLVQYASKCGYTFARLKKVH